jgi:hypothetical protein
MDEDKRTLDEEVASAKRMEIAQLEAEPLKESQEQKKGAEECLGSSSLGAI